ncbi:amidohydrolase [Acrocarpospora pleiomorpha]|uniref:amidohydrolase n=1 Tax=Acrocarpospora pleiomorpha TaxID=90975 RepID=UPI0031E1669A
MPSSPDPAGPATVVAGPIRTMDPARPLAEAMLVAGDRIAATGDLADVRALAGAHVPVHQAAGPVLPGFIDSHLHVLTVGLERRRLTISEAESVAEVVDRIRDWLAANPTHDRVVAGAHFHEEDLAEGRLPTAADLDPVSPGVALYLDRRTHDAIVNSEAMRRAGIGRATPDPPGGRIERTPNGEPTGVLIERPAADLVFSLIPPPSAEELAAALEEAQPHLHSLGVTGASEPGLYPHEMAVYQDAWRTGRLTLRTMGMPLADTDIPPERFLRGLGGLGVRTGFGDELFKLGPLKVYLDGAGGFGTALLSRPWPGTDGYHGNQTCGSETFEELVRFCAREGWSMAVHAVGDEAVRVALAEFERADAQWPIRDLRFSIMHCYLWPSAESMALAGRLGVLLSTQPAMQWRVAAGIAARFGAPAAATAPLRDWLDAGVTVAGGSDGPDFPMSPLFGMWQARTRRVRGLEGPLGPEQAITAEEALRMYTVDAARYCFADGERGWLAPGALADWVELDADPVETEDEKVADIRVLRTVVGGQTVYAG